MKTNLAYIDDVMDRAIAAQEQHPTLPANARQHAVQAGRKLIGGFRVYDEEAEKEALDALIESRKRQINQFRADRNVLWATLKERDVTALAICPVEAWKKVCKDTGLFVVSPDADGKIKINPEAFQRHTDDRTLDWFATEHWEQFLEQLLPGRREHISSGYKARILFPDPPADVAEVLRKVNGLKLQVAAVASAIKLADKPSEIKRQNAHPKDQWAQALGYADYADWLKRDPIIFHEYGTAAAIIAQFGEFPIEKAVVDAAISVDALLGDTPKPFEEIQGTSRGEGYPLIEARMLSYLQASLGFANAQQGASQFSDLYGWTGRRS